MTVACCVTCHKRVRLVLTGRGRLLPVHPAKTPAPLAVQGTKVRYLWGETPQLLPGERYAVAHWDKSPACRPERRPRGQSAA